MRNPATTKTDHESSDWVKFTIDRPMSEEPGTRWNYNSGASALLAYVFHRATKTDIEEYAAKNLFAPLGIERWFWKRSPHGLADTEGGLYLEARDLPKIWYLFLENGVWDGRQIVSSDWVKASVTPAIAVSPAPNAPKYGFKWWLYPDPRDNTKYLERVGIRRAGADDVSHRRHGGGVQRLEHPAGSPRAAARSGHDAARGRSLVRE